MKDPFEDGTRCEVSEWYTLRRLPAAFNPRLPFENRAGKCQIVVQHGVVVDQERFECWQSAHPDVALSTPGQIDAMDRRMASVREMRKAEVLRRRIEYTGIESELGSADVETEAEPIDTTTTLDRLLRAEAGRDREIEMEDWSVMQRAA